MPSNHNNIEKRMWDTADEQRANSMANHKFTIAQKDIAGRSTCNIPKLIPSELNVTTFSLNKAVSEA